MPSERKRLFDLIDSTGAGGVVFISGDRHAGALYSTKLGSEAEAVYPLYELTTSGLTEFYPGARMVLLVGPGLIAPRH
jgi:alkaline phosphatase D